MAGILNYLATVLYSPASGSYYSSQPSSTSEYPSHPPQPTITSAPVAPKPPKADRGSWSKPGTVGMLPIFILIFIIVLLAASWFLPWWQHDYQVEDTDYKTVTEYDLEGIHTYQELTDTLEEQVCPFCGEDLDEYDLEEKDFYCEECYGGVNEREVCPLCEDSIYGTYCNNCDQTVDPETAYYCYECDEIVEPIYGYDCWDCDKAFKEPEEIESGIEGERGYFGSSYGDPLYFMGYMNIKHENLYGMRGYSNTANVWGTTNILWLLSIVFLVITLIAIILYKYVDKIRSSKKARKGIFILTIITLLFVIITPLFFATAYGMAVDQDYEDRYENMPEDSKPDEQIPKGFMGQDSQPVGESGTDVDHQWGPATGWFLAFIAMIFGFVALVIMVKTLRVRKPRPPRAPSSEPGRVPAPAPPQQYAQPPAPAPAPPPQPTYPDYSQPPPPPPQQPYY